MVDDGPLLTLRAIARRWRCDRTAAKNTMLRNGFTPVPYGAKRYRWRLSDVEDIERCSPMGQAVLGQLAKAVRELDGKR